MKNNTPKNGTSGINIQVPRGGFRIEEAQFQDLSKTPSGTTDLDILIEDGRKNLSGEFDVHDKLAVNSHIVRSNRENKNRVFTLEKRENKKDKTVSYWFIPVNPGKENAEYPAFVLQRVVLPGLPKTSRLVARIKKTARNIFLPAGTALAIAGASIAVKKTLDYKGEENSDRLKYTIVEDPAITEQPAINIVEIPSTEKAPTAPEEEIEVEKPEEMKNIYKVKKGDTMSGIAKHFKVDLKALLALNNLTEDSVIEIDQEINLGDLTEVKEVEKKLTAGLTRIQHFNLILEQCDIQGVNNKAQKAYILATAQHETDYLKTMEEYASGEAYNGRSDLGNTEPGDGPFFKGGGYGQLTGRLNYTKYDALLKKVGLIRKDQSILINPELVKEPKIAAFIVVHGMIHGNFTGKKLGTYINNEKQDWEGARRCVNGTDRDTKIASEAQEILKTL